ncbi:MAG: nitrogen fixation protein NifU [Dehalococcoidia bacterium SM23_28_1]|nr:MAG: nitrogen fixation protein NifU [Dehalococcoidia bacterium SM23_28_1]
MSKISFEAVQEVLDEIRPALQADGGNVELLEVSEDGIVKLELVGACAGCPMATMTLRAGIERLLFERIPDIVAVEGFSGGQRVGELEGF